MSQIGSHKIEIESKLEFTSGKTPIITKITIELNVLGKPSCLISLPKPSDVTYLLGVTTSPTSKSIEASCLNCKQPDSIIEIESVLTPIDNMNSRAFLTRNDKTLDWGAALIDDIGDYKVTVTTSIRSVAEACS